MTQRAGRTFAVGAAMAVANTLIGAMQPVILRYGAMRIDPLVFSAASVIVAGICALPVLFIRGEMRILADRRYAPRLVLVSMAGTVSTTLCLIYGLRRINAITGVLLLQTEPIYSILLATMFVGERPSTRQMLATAAIIAGVSCVVGGGSFDASIATLLLLMTPLFWQISHVIALPIMPPLAPGSVASARYIFAAVAMASMLPFAAPEALRQAAEPGPLAVIVVTGLVIDLIASFAWYGAISRLSLAWTTALVVPGIPILSILFAVAFLGEHAAARQLIGIAIAVSGVLALVLGADPHRKHHAAETLEAVHQPLT
jgi:drug/metabolite transporter (DMT)-like permease